MEKQSRWSTEQRSEQQVQRSERHVQQQERVQRTEHHYTRQMMTQHQGECLPRILTQLYLYHLTIPTLQLSEFLRRGGGAGGARGSRPRVYLVSWCVTLFVHSAFPQSEIVRLFWGRVGGAGAAGTPAYFPRSLFLLHPRNDLTVSARSPANASTTGT